MVVGLDLVFWFFAGLVLVWFLLEAIFILAVMSRGVKKGQVIGVFVVMGVLFVVLLVFLAFNHGWLLRLLEVSC